MARLKTGVLISGRGSNLKALIDACHDPAFPAEIVTVISNKAQAAGLAFARDASIPTIALDQRAFADRAAFDLADLDVFVGLVGLVDRAGAADDGGEAGALELAGLGGVGHDPRRAVVAGEGAGQALGRPGYTRQGLETLEWLTAIQTNKDGSFRPVGTDSFGREYSDPLPYDQQPLEAQATVEACVAAYKATGDERWAQEAEKAYGWFIGRNDLGVPLASRGDGGCHDGLMPHGLNRNQGAESILALQLANVAMSALSFKEHVVTKTRGAA